MSNQEFKNLKDLLLKPEQEELQRLNNDLQQLQKKLEDKKVLLDTLKPILTPLLREKISEQPQEIAAALSPIIAESLKKQVDVSRNEIVAALAPIMGQAIKKQVQETREEIVDALYPVIGQTIRKAVSEAMKRLAQTVNDKINQTLSIGLLMKKIKSRLFGIPVEEYLLKDFLPFQIQEIFYIHRTSGILLAHVSDKERSTGTDDELIGGMLTAIKDFAENIFSSETERELNNIAYDDLQIYLEAGRHAYLAAVTSGVTPEDFTDKLRELEQDLHQEYQQPLRDFAGDLTPLQPVQYPLRHFLRQYSRSERTDTQPAATAASTGWVYLLIIFIIVGSLFAALYTLPEKIRQHKIHSQLTPHLQEYPLHLVNEFHWDYRDQNLHLEGWVHNSEEKRIIGEYLTSQLGIADLENELQVKPSAEDLKIFHDRLVASLQENMKTDLSQLQFVLENDVLCLRGSVLNSEEKVLILSKVLDIIKVPMVVGDLSVLQESFQQQEVIKREIEQTSIHFGENQSGIAEEYFPLLDQLAEKLGLLSFESLHIFGYCDSLGGEQENLELSRRRASNVKDYLILKGIDSEKLWVIAAGKKSPIADNKSAEGRSQNRRVNFQFNVQK